MTEDELREKIRRLVTGPEAQVTEAVEAASRASGISKALILGHTRRADVVRARHSAMMLAYDAGVVLEDIGFYMNRDHTTVLHGIRRAREFLGKDKEPVFRTTRLTA